MQQTLTKPWRAVLQIKELLVPEKSPTGDSLVQISILYGQLFYRMGVTPFATSLSGILSLASILFNLMALALLAPTIKGLVRQDFNELQNQRIFAPVFELIPAQWHTSSALFIVMVSLVFLCGSIKILCSYLSSVLIYDQSNNIQRTLGTKVFEKLLSFNKSYWDRTPQSFTTSLITEKVHQVSFQLIVLHRLLLDAVTLLAYVALLLCLSPKLVAVIAIICPLMTIASTSTVQALRKTSDKLHALRNTSRKRIQSSVTNFPLISSLGMEDSERSNYESLTLKIHRITKQTARLEMLIGPGKEFFSLLTILITAGLITWLHNPAELSEKGANLLVFILIVKLSAPVYHSLSQKWVGLNQSLPALREINHLLFESDSFVTKNGPIAISGINKEIQFKNLNFHYSNKEEFAIFRDLSFTIPANQITALIGPSGSGKSTITQILLRQYPVPNGKVFLDGIDLNHIDLQSNKRLYSTVSQYPYLVEGSLAENIKFGFHGHPRTGEIQRVAKEAGLGPLLTRSQFGLETPVGESGVLLSGGEKQRLSIARALLRDSPILILDEPTSSLDEENSDGVLQSLRRHWKNKTVILITHRMEQTSLADSIIQFDHEGRVKSATNTTSQFNTNVDD